MKNELKPVAVRFSRKRTNVFELCDICHKGKPKDSLEVIVVKYRKCKTCNVGGMDNVETSTDKQVNFDMPPVNRNMPQRRMMRRVSPLVSEVFKRPAEMGDIPPTGPVPRRMEKVVVPKMNPVEKSTDAETLNEIMK